MKKNKDIIKIMQKNISEIEKNHDCGIYLSDLISDTEKHPLSLPEKMFLSKSLLQSVKELHDQGYLHLSLCPYTIFLKDYSPEKWSETDIVFMDLTNVVKKETANQRKDFVINKDYSAEELILYERYNNNELIKEYTDIFSLAMLCQFIFYEDHKLHNPCPENAVFNGILSILLQKGMKREPSYRFASITEMTAILDDLISADTFFRNNDYLKLFLLAYDYNLNLQNCQIKHYHIDHEQLKNALDGINSLLHTQSVDKSKVLFLYPLFEEILNTHNDDITRDEMILFYSEGIRINNHIGNSRESLRLYDQLLKLDINEETLMDTIPAVATAYTDMCCYEESARIATNMIEKLESRKRKDQNTYMWLGRAYSSLACSLAYLGDPREKTLESFDKSLRCFKKLKNEKDRIDNINITRCHILQYACELKDKTLFEKHGSLYYANYIPCKNSNNTTANFKFDSGKITSILKEYDKRNFSDQFGFFALIKGIYCFYITDKRATQIYKCLDRLLYGRNINKNTCRYPLSMIEYYMALIEIQIHGDMNSKAESYFDNALNYDVDALNQPFKIQVVMWFCILWKYNTLNGLTDDNSNLYTRLKIICSDEKWDKLYNKLEKTGSLENILNYEFA